MGPWPGASSPAPGRPVLLGGGGGGGAVLPVVLGVVTVEGLRGPTQANDDGTSPGASSAPRRPCDWGGRTVAPEAEAEAAAVELAEQASQGPPEAMRELKAMFRDLEGSAARIAHENALLVEFQRSGAGLPKRP